MLTERYGDDLLRAYGAVGRVEGALAQAAQEVFERLDAHTEQLRAEGLFVHLVRPGGNRRGDPAHCLEGRVQ